MTCARMHSSGSSREPYGHAVRMNRKGTLLHALDAGAAKPGAFWPKVLGTHMAKTGCPATAPEKKQQAQNPVLLLAGWSSQFLLTRLLLLPRIDSGACDETQATH